MTPGEMIQLGVSGVIALVCFFVRSETQKVSTKIDSVNNQLQERIYKLEFKNMSDDTAVKDWARDEHTRLRDWVRGEISSVRDWVDKYYQSRGQAR